MHNNAFYSGVLVELKKQADNAQPAPAPAIKPASPGIMDSAKQGFGVVHGMFNEFGHNHPFLNPIGNYGANSANNRINKQVSGVNICSHNPEPGKALTPYNQGYLQGSPYALNTLNNDKTGLPNNTCGTTTYNANTNSMDTDYSKIPGYLGTHLADFMKNHWGWVAGGAGVAGIGALLYSMYHNKQNQNQQQQQAQQPQLPPPQPNAPSFL